MIIIQLAKMTIAKLLTLSCVRYVRTYLYTLSLFYNMIMKYIG